MAASATEAQSSYHRMDVLMGLLLSSSYVAECGVVGGNGAKCSGSERAGCSSSAKDPGNGNHRDRSGMPGFKEVVLLDHDGAASLEDIRAIVSRPVLPRDPKDCEIQVRDPASLEFQIFLTWIVWTVYHVRERSRDPPGGVFFPLKNAMSSFASRAKRSPHTLPRTSQTMAKCRGRYVMSLAGVSHALRPTGEEASLTAGGGPGQKCQDKKLVGRRGFDVLTQKPPGLVCHEDTHCLYAASPRRRRYPPDSFPPHCSS